MAKRTFKVEIITPDEAAFSGEAESLTAPGAKGYLGILVDHAPLVTPLTEGRVELRSPGKPVVAYAVKGGFLEVSKNRVLILTESVKSVAASQGA